MKNASTFESDLLARLEKLERQYGWMRAGLICVLLVGSFFVFFPAKAPEENKTLKATKTGTNGSFWDMTDIPNTMQESISFWTH